MRCRLDRTATRSAAEIICEKFAHTHFEPSGWTNNPDIGFAKSIMDYIFRWLQLRFTGQQQLLFENLRPKSSAQLSEDAASGMRRSETGNREPGAGSIHAADALAGIIDLGDAPTCSFCGSIMRGMVRAIAAAVAGARAVQLISWCCHF